jgi:hypothetical protein
MPKELRTPNRREIRVFKSAVRTTSVDEGIIEAIVSAFGVDEPGYWTRMRQGCWAAGLAEKLPAGVWMHKADQTVAKTLIARELAPGDPLLPDELKLLGGLYIKGQFNLQTQRGREAFSDIQFGIVDEFSVGFYVVRSEYDWDTDIEEFIECNCYEWSPVLRGANPGNSLLSVRDASPEGRTMADHAEAFRGNADAFVARLDAIVEQRGKMSDTNRQRLRDVETCLRASADKVAAKLATASAPVTQPDGEGLRQVTALRMRELELRTRRHPVAA